MLEIEYTTSNQETADVTLVFMLNRPLMSGLFTFMKFACILLCAMFVLVALNRAIRPQDATAALFALVWLFYYKKINKWVIKQTLKYRKFDDIKCLYKIDDKSILYQLHNFAPQNIQWKKLKYVLQNKDGYIIPLTGITNAGKFLWLPLRCLQHDNAEQTFLEYLQKFKIPTKTI